MQRASILYGQLLDGLMLMVCLLLLSMTALICAEVILRNVSLSGLDFGNEISEDILYLSTLLSAPWLLRKGQHVRIDIVLRMLPSRAGWLMEWAGDLAGLACCLLFVWYGTVATLSSAQTGTLSIKTLVIPDWWALAPLPVAFALLAVEFVFRMHRLKTMDRGIRDDAVSAS